MQKIKSVEQALFCKLSDVIKVGDTVEWAGSLAGQNDECQLVSLAKLYNALKDVNVVTNVNGTWREVNLKKAFSAKLHSVFEGKTDITLHVNGRTYSTVLCLLSAIKGAMYVCIEETVTKHMNYVGAYLVEVPKSARNYDEDLSYTYWSERKFLSNMKITMIIDDDCNTYDAKLAQLMDYNNCLPIKFVKKDKYYCTSTYDQFKLDAFNHLVINTGNFECPNFKKDKTDKERTMDIIYRLYGIDTSMPLSKKDACLQFLRKYPETYILWTDSFWNNPDILDNLNELLVSGLLNDKEYELIMSKIDEGSLGTCISLSYDEDETLSVIGIEDLD